MSRYSVTSTIATVIVSCVLLPLANTQAGVNVTIVDLDGKHHSGELTKLSATALTLRGESISTFDIEGIQRLRLNGKAERRRSRQAILLLANHDRLAVEPTRIDDETIVANWINYPQWPPISIPLEAVRGFAHRLPRNRALRLQVIRRLIDRRSDSDEVSLLNGDRVKGEFMGMADAKYQIESKVGKATIDAKDVSAIGFNSELISFPTVDGPVVLMTLTDGSRFTVRDVMLASPTEDAVSCKTLFGNGLQVTLSALESLQFLGGRFVYLSELKPFNYRSTPFLSRHWDLQTNRTVLGGQLLLRGTNYALGIGMHSKSEVSYKLDGKFSRFQATIGIDDETNGGGSVVFAIDADAKRVFTSKLITGKSTAVVIPPIDVDGVSVLTLHVDFGTFGDINDHADWCDAVLIRKRIEESRLIDERK